MVRFALDAVLLAAFLTTARGMIVVLVILVGTLLLIPSIGAYVLAILPLDADGARTRKRLSRFMLDLLQIPLTIVLMLLGFLLLHAIL